VLIVTGQKQWWKLAKAARLRQAIDHHRRMQLHEVEYHRYQQAQPELRKAK